ncbi:hypothetical protein RSAG8_07342, partial [Rhizoctonia solani AG-8 WAC10335]
MTVETADEHRLVPSFPIVPACGLEDKLEALGRSGCYSWIRSAHGRLYQPAEDRRLGSNSVSIRITALDLSALQHYAAHILGKHIPKVQRDSMSPSYG